MFSDGCCISFRGSEFEVLAVVSWFLNTPLFRFDKRITRYISLFFKFFLGVILNKDRIYKMQVITTVIKTTLQFTLPIRDLHTYVQRLSFQLDKWSPSLSLMDLVSDTSEIWLVCSPQTNFVPCKFSHINQFKYCCLLVKEKKNLACMVNFEHQFDCVSRLT